jgi:hypothetical protein
LNQLSELVFPPQEATPERASTREKNKGRLETRTLVSKPTSGEEIGFPLAQQAALLHRQCQGRNDELVALVTSAPPSRLDVATWLRLNRQHWGIESSLHQRLDVSHNDDRCRVRNHNSMWVLAMMRRLSNSLFMHWRQRKRCPDHVTTTDFQSFLSEDHHRQAMRLVLAKSPRL